MTCVADATTIETMTTASAPVAPKIMPGLPPNKAVTNPAMRAAYSPTSGATPATEANAKLWVQVPATRSCPTGFHRAAASASGTGGNHHCRISLHTRRRSLAGLDRDMNDTSRKGLDRREAKADEIHPPDIATTTYSGLARMTSPYHVGHIRPVSGEGRALTVLTNLLYDPTRPYG